MFVHAVGKKEKNGGFLTVCVSEVPQGSLDANVTSSDAGKRHAACGGSTPRF
jgi:hypothetical protein